jgi:hypothetical protein
MLDGWLMGVVDGGPQPPQQLSLKPNSDQSNLEALSSV